MFDNAQRGRTRFLVSPKSVEQDCLGPVECGDPDSFAASCHLDAAVWMTEVASASRPRSARSPTLA